jgi:hypothetical protein
LYGLARVAAGSLVNVVAGGGVAGWTVGLGAAAIVAEKMIGKDLRAGMSAMQFAITGWTQGRREPINFLPLTYGTRPYIAGVKGMRRSDWWETGYEALQRFTYYRFVQAPRYISQILDEAVAESLDGGTGGGKIR